MAMSRAERRRAEKLAKKSTKDGGTVNINALMQVAQDHYRSNRLPQALKALDELIGHLPDRTDILGTAGMIAIDLKKFDQASKYYERSIKLSPDEAKAQFGLALAEKSLGNFDRAAVACRRAVDLSNDATEPLRNLILLLLNLGETEDIPELARRLLVHEPHNTEAAMYEGMAYYHLGEREKAEAIFGYDTLVEVHDLEAPDGYADLGELNKALASHIVDHPTMAVPDESHPTYHNKDLHITRELIGPNGDDDPGPVGVLETMIAEKVEDYLARRRGEIDHEFLKRWPQKSRLTAWGTLLKGQGNLVSHIHPDGYLGMVYYPDLPEEMHSQAANSGEDQRGFLELGRPPDDFPVKVETDIYTIQPKEGRLVIFPGYFFHRTVPFESKGRRISIAFDVVAQT